jgi:hypothetical protein
MPVPVAAEIEFSGEECEALEWRAGRPSSAQGLGVVVAGGASAARGLKNTEIAASRGSVGPMVTAWRNWFLEHPARGRTDEPRPGAAEDDHRREGRGSSG